MFKQTAGAVGKSTEKVRTVCHKFHIVHIGSCLQTETFISEDQLGEGGNIAAKIIVCAGILQTVNGYAA